MKDRAPVVAGSFYPDSVTELEQDLAEMLSSSAASKIKPKALIVPHAGYCYSGQIAASAFSALKNINTLIRRVVLLGPGHRVYLSGCAVPGYHNFVTPLGKIPVDRASCRMLLASGLVSQQDEAHRLEHSLEVELPFLQTCLTDFQLVPIVVGETTANEVSNLLALFSNAADTLFVVSTDLSHYHSVQQAKLIDDRTIAAILSYDLTSRGDDACGCYALNGLLDYAHKKNWQISLVQQGNSGDNMGNKEKVVGYASFILY